MTFQTKQRNMQFAGCSVFIQFMFWHHMLGCAEPLWAHIIPLCFCLPVLEPNRYFSHVTASLKNWFLWSGFLPLDATETVIIQLTAQQWTWWGIEKKSFNIINNNNALYFYGKALSAHWFLSLHCSKCSIILSFSKTCSVILCIWEWLIFSQIILITRCLWGLFVSRDNNCSLKNGQKLWLMSFKRSLSEPLLVYKVALCLIFYSNWHVVTVTTPAHLFIDVFCLDHFITQVEKCIASKSSGIRKISFGINFHWTCLIFTGPCLSLTARKAFWVYNRSDWWFPLHWGWFLPTAGKNT